MATQLDNLLETNRFASIAALYRLGSNFDVSESPFTLFLDLIGWTKDEFGETWFDYEDKVLGYLEGDQLADALKEWANAGRSAEDYVADLMNAERADD